MVLSQFKTALESLGVRQIETLEHPFDPNKHEALMRGDAPEEQGRLSKEMGSGVIRFAEGSDQDADAAGSGVHDFTTGSFGVLGAFRVHDPQSAGTRSVCGKFNIGGTIGWDVEFTSDTRLQFRIDDNVTPTVSLVIAPFDLGDLILFYGRRHAGNAEVDLFTALGDDLANADATGSITNAGFFSVGALRSGSILTAAGIELAYLAIVSTATLAEGIGAAQLSNLHQSLGLGTIF